MVSGLWTKGTLWDKVGLMWHSSIGHLLQAPSCHPQMLGLFVLLFVWVEMKEELVHRFLIQRHKSRMGPKLRMGV